MSQQEALDAGLMATLLSMEPNDRGWRSRLGRSESTGQVFQATLSPEGEVTIDGPLPGEAGDRVVARKRVLEIPDDTSWGGSR